MEYGFGAMSASRLARSACLLGLAALAGCAQNALPPAEAPASASAPPAVAAGVAGVPTVDPAEVVLTWLEGAFDSRRQAQTDDEFLAISLRHCRVKAPELGSRVLYVEQARADALDQPYRQRVYSLVADPPGAVVYSHVYELKEPAALVGVCARAGEAFVGGTEGRGCGSALRGARYATSIIEVSPLGVRSWDRGFDEEGAQVWGAKKGPYEFRRNEAPASPAKGR